jgi:hypothetical protein
MRDLAGWWIAADQTFPKLLEAGCANGSRARVRHPPGALT